MRTTFKYSVLFINLFGLLVLCGCSGVESKYNEIYKIATSSLASLQDSINGMSSYAYTKQYEEIEAKYNSAVDALKLEVAESEKETAKLDTLAKGFSSLAESAAAIGALKDKNQTILDSLVNRKWIRLDPKGEGDIDTNLIFYFNDSLITAQGYKKKFPYELKDGNIYTESIGNIYCTLNDSMLVLQNESETEAYYRLATANEQLAGYWTCSNSANSIKLNKNGTGSFPNDSKTYDGSYSFKNNKLTVSCKYLLDRTHYCDLRFYYTYNPGKDNIHMYNFYQGFFEKNYSANQALSRSIKMGPKSLSILFDREEDDD